MERLRGQYPTRKLGGGLKDQPLCEHCGRPVRITGDDCTREEILCPSCASDARFREFEEYEFIRR